MKQRNEQCIWKIVIQMRLTKQTIERQTISAALSLAYGIVLISTRVNQLAGCAINE